MGVGNYYIKGGQSVYIDHCEIYGEWDSERNQHSCIEDESDFSWRYQDLVEDIRSVLSDSFSNDEGWRDDDRIISSNGLFLVTIIDWSCYFSINVVPRDDIDCSSLAQYHLDSAASKIFEALSQQFKLSVRCCAWTSGEYQGRNVA